jgi:DNA/RNA-binding domain of Phe-tRNA-synthetase-like protein
MTTGSGIERGWVDSELAGEFPHLMLHVATVEARPARSTRVAKQRLRRLSDRYTGGKAVNLRQEPIPWAYRVFFRQIGIDPDDQRTPPEEAALERMKWGGFRSHSLLDDALTIAIVETGVAVIALDADRVAGPVGLRLSRPGERLGSEEGRPLSARQIVIADGERSLAVLFGDPAEDAAPERSTERMLLVAVQVKGVPEVSVEEALWLASEVLAEGAPEP